jgi:two-component system cell cycle response regulator
MTARVLVVDDILANVKLLEARLTAEYFDVVSAMNGLEALTVCAEVMPDIVLLDVMMPGMDGFEVCRRIKANPATAHIPVVMVTALDQISDRVKGLEAGADDFLTKPVSDVALVTRVRSLSRLKMLTDELRMRAAASRDRSIEGDFDIDQVVGSAKGRILVVEDRRSTAERLQAMLGSAHAVTLQANPQEALLSAADGAFELVVVSLALANFDALRLCSQLRSLDRTRMLPILLIVDPEDQPRLLRGLEIGVNDYLTRPIDRQELLARVRTQIRRKRYNDHLRDNVQQTIEMAVTDGLTGLHNRRYMSTHLATLTEQAKERGKPLSVLILDIDFFQAINDTHGHDAGDEVLREFADRMRSNVRGIDLCCRYGGEEFVIVMPDTDLNLAQVVAERLRQRVAGDPFVIAGGVKQIDVTISIGLGSLDGLQDTDEQIMKRADLALYRAKRNGRNCVVSDAA